MIEIRVLASGSTGNCYLVGDGQTSLLLEAGIPFVAIQSKLWLRDWSLSDCAACLISHEHQDHAKAARHLMKGSVDCYMSQGTADALNAEGHRLHIVKAQEQFTVGSWTILPFAVEHDAAEPLGFLLASGDEKLLYATDTAYLRYRFTGLTHIMIDANYALDVVNANIERGDFERVAKHRLLHSHMSLDHVKAMLEETDLSRVKEIWLLHLSNRNADAERFKREVQEISGKVVRVA